MSVEVVCMECKWTGNSEDLLPVKLKPCKGMPDEELNGKCPECGAEFQTYEIIRHENSTLS